MSLNKNVLLTALIVFLLSSILPLSGLKMQVTAASTTNPWPTFHANNARTGYSSAQAPDTNNLDWSYTTGGEVLSSPAVAHGKVFFGSTDGKLYALDQVTGSQKWSYNAGEGIVSSPAVADGMVFFCTVGDHTVPSREVYALDQGTGSYVWSRTIGTLDLAVNEGSPAVADGKVFINDGNGELYALNEYSGTTIWHKGTGGDSASGGPAVSGSKVFAAGAYLLYAFDIDTGEKEWSFYPGDPIIGNTVSGSRVFTCSGTKVMARYTSNGNSAWTRDLGSGVKPKSTPAVANGKVFVLADDAANDRERVYALSESSGSIQWSRNLGYYSSPWPIFGHSSPAVADGKVYVGSWDNKIYCLYESNGNIRWSYTTGNKVVSSPAVSDGAVFVGSWDKKLYSFKDTPPETTTVTVNPNGGKIYVDDSPITSQTDYEWIVGSNHELDPDSGYSPSTGKRLMFTQWSDGNSDDPRTITVPSSGVAYTAQWKTQYRLIIQVNPSEGGTTNPSPGAHWYDSSTNVLVNETPNTGYEFDHWDLDGSNVGSGTPCSVHMNTYHTLTAVFNALPVQHKLTVYSALDSPDPPNGNHYYDDGTLVIASVTSPVTEGDTIWTCTGWTGTGSVPPSGSNPSVSFKITMDSSITWNWQGDPVMYDIDLTSRTDDENPNIGKIIFKGIAEPDEEHSLPTTITKASASYIVWARLEDSGYEDSYNFLRWETSGDVTADPIGLPETLVTITGDGELTAVWELRVLIISRCLPDGATYRPGSAVTLACEVTDNSGNPVIGCSVLAFVTAPSEAVPLTVVLTDLNNGEYAYYWEIPDSGEAGTYTVSFQASTTRYTAYASDNFIVDTGTGHIASDAWIGNVEPGESVYYDFFIPYQETTMPYYLDVVMRSDESDYLVLNLIDSEGNHVPASGTNPQRITIENRWGSFRIQIYGSSVNNGIFYVGYMSEYGYNRIFEVSEMWKEVAIFALQEAAEEIVHYLIEKCIEVGISVTVGNVVGLALTSISIADWIITFEEYQEGRCLIITSITTDGQSHVGTAIMDGVIFDLTTVVASKTIHHLLEEFYQINIRAEDFPGYTFHHWEDLAGDPTYLIYSRETWVTLTEAISIMRAVYEPVEPTESKLTVTAFSPVNIMVTDPSGSRVGYDPVTGEVLNEILGAIYSGLGTEPQVITIPSPLPGVYVIDRYGTGAGAYMIVIESTGSDGTVVQSGSWSGVASPGETERGSIQMFEDGTFVDAPFSIIPEVPLGTIIASTAMIIALVAYITMPKWRRKQKDLTK